MSLSLCLPHMSLERYCQKNVVKGRGFQKIYKGGNDHIGVSIEGAFKSSAYYGVVRCGAFRGNALSEIMKLNFSVKIMF